jgi:hypothetical protein
MCPKWAAVHFWRLLRNRTDTGQKKKRTMTRFFESTVILGYS